MQGETGGSGHATTTRSNEKQYYYYEEYVTKKRQAADVARHKSTRKFVNSVKIVNRLQNEPLTSKKIFNYFKNSIGDNDLKFNENDLKSILSLYPFHDNRTFILKFNDNFNAHKLYGKTAIIDGVLSFDMVDPNRAEKKFTLKAILRFHWLSYETEDYKIDRFLKDHDIKVNSLVIREKYDSTSELSFLENGVRKVHVEYDLEDHDEIADLLGIIEIDGQRSLLQLCGLPPKCLFCKKFGHRLSDCKDHKVKCDKCKKRGHTTENCDIAKRITKVNETPIDLPNENETNPKPEDEIANATSIQQLPIDYKAQQTKRNLEHSPSEETQPQKTKVTASTETKTNKISPNIDRFISSDEEGDLVIDDKDGVD